MPMRHSDFTVCDQRLAVVLNGRNGGTNGVEAVIEETSDDRPAGHAATTTVFYCFIAMTKS
jgi:hypothetical protein